MENFGQLIPPQTFSKAVDKMKTKKRPGEYAVVRKCRRYILFFVYIFFLKISRRVFEKNINIFAKSIKIFQSASKINILKNPYIFIISVFSTQEF